MSHPEESHPTFVVNAWRRLLRVAKRARRNAGKQSRAKPAAKKAPRRNWGKLRKAIKLTFAWRKPRIPARRRWLQRQLRTWRRRVATFRATVSGWRYWVMVVAAAAVVAGAGYAAYKAWRHEQLRKETVATVNDKPITRTDLAAEVIASGADFKQLNAAARKQLLDRVIERRLLVDVAAKQGLNTDPRTAALRARADESFLANLVMQRFAGTPPQPPSEQDARKFMAAHPAMFAQRQTFVIDGFNCVLSSIPTNPQVVFASLDSTERYLEEIKAPHRRRLQTLGSADLPTPAIDVLLKIKPGDVFVMPMGRTILIGSVVNRLPANTPPEIQLETARSVLEKQQTEARLRAAVDELRSKAAIRYTQR